MRNALRLAAFLLTALSIVAQNLAVVPARAMFDEPAVIAASGLHPAERVTIRAELTDGAGHSWESHADFVADSAGAVDVSKAAPIAGSYKDVSAMGLVWSMMPRERNVGLYQPIRSLGPQKIDFTLARKGAPELRATLEQGSLARGTEAVPVHDDGLRGVFLTPPGQGTHPGVLVLTGSNGGLPIRPAAWLAAHGYAVLALAYFRYEDLPPMLEAIPLEYFERALAWMSKRPEIAGQRIAVMGTSRGGELALQLGSMFPRIAAVVAYVPADVRFPACCGATRVPYAWTWEGRPLPYMPARMPRAQELAARAAIEVEKTHGPVLMISGEDDHVWRSWEMADAVVARLKRARFAYRFENLKYPHAGHAAGRPAIQPAWHGDIRHPVSGRGMDLGGSPKGDADSSLDSMPKVLAFLAESLAGGR